MLLTYLSLFQNISMSACDQNTAKLLPVKPYLVACNAVYLSSFQFPLSFLGSDSETFSLVIPSSICMNYIIYVKRLLFSACFSISDRFKYRKILPYVIFQSP